MKVLLLGSGGREHALALSLARSPLLTRLLIAPGNPGTAVLGLNLPVDLTDLAAIVALAQRETVDLVVVGPEAPLVAGVVDRLSDVGILAFGPSQAAAALEGSKGFTKDLCREVAIPTAAYARFDDGDAARAYLSDHPLPVVIKADGLAAGKGVIIAETRADAEAAIDDMFGGSFGSAGASVVVEAFLSGEEVSFFAICDGTRALGFGSAQDHKRVGDGDTGPNTGGMGAISPARLVDAALEARIMGEIIQPTLRGMSERGTPFRGVLFAGLMVENGAPQLIEYNVRLGDPETQVILPRLHTDLLPLMLASARGHLPNTPPVFDEATALTVVLAANGYPAHPIKGTRIGDLTAAEGCPGVTVFHAGTRQEADALLADGGRVLTVTALGRDAAEAQARAYAAVDAIDWPGGFCRRDIGWRAVRPVPPLD
ncbi:phosphoribosylamine--glycine ligase [Lichenihabitans psoromatis]|uniref:phosphoribosylamine--glycine ligase n=1 Tax=Lichenihabitans psoromatis TaxID=2528642 RepID=UPI0010385145|nr:phosphoribosylamine--glycine ligase [Lichenihabitans psoromatis]